MDFRFSDEEEAFRKEVQDFLRESLPPDWPGAIDVQHDEAFDELHQLGTEMRRKIAAKGWIGISWPKEYGGQGDPVAKQMILEEEFAYRVVPGYDHLLLNPSVSNRKRPAGGHDPEEAAVAPEPLHGESEQGQRVASERDPVTVALVSQGLQRPPGEQDGGERARAMPQTYLHRPSPPAQYRQQEAPIPPEPP